VLLEAVEDINRVFDLGQIDQPVPTASVLLAKLEDPVANGLHRPNIVRRLAELQPAQVSAQILRTLLGKDRSTASESPSHATSAAACSSSEFIGRTIRLTYTQKCIRGKGASQVRGIIRPKLTAVLVLNTVTPGHQEPELVAQAALDGKITSP
jgi:hypothetical protein